MRSTVELLTSKERAALALLFGTDAFQALRRLCELEIAGLGKDALGATELVEVYRYKGKAEFAANLPKLIKLIAGEDDKSKKS